MKQPAVCLEATNIAAGYGPMQVLWGVDLQIVQAEAVVLLGGNGAGKSTLLRSLLGLVPLRSGQIRFFGDRIDALAPNQRVQAGISFMSETGVFPGLTVEENIRLGGHGLSKPALRDRVERIWMRFPELARRRKLAADTLSGGQRKLLGVARAMVREPRLLIMDEPSSGLSPVAVTELVATLTRVRYQD
ncbi:MAG TPA: ATP-binding cassette domain-containing protein, partial [Streptosporangiaceae bacterium]